MSFILLVCWSVFAPQFENSQVEAEVSNTTYLLGTVTSLDRNGGTFKFSSVWKVPHFFKQSTQADGASDGKPAIEWGHAEGFGEFSFATWYLCTSEGKTVGRESQEWRDLRPGDTIAIATSRQVSFTKELKKGGTLFIVPKAKN